MKENSFDQNSAPNASWLETLLPRLLLCKRENFSPANTHMLVECIRHCEELLEIEKLKKNGQNGPNVADTPYSVLLEILRQSAPGLRHSSADAEFLDGLRKRYAAYKKSRWPNGLADWLSKWEKDLSISTDELHFNSIKETAKKIVSLKAKWESTAQKKRFSKLAFFDKIVIFFQVQQFSKRHIQLHNEKNEVEFLKKTCDMKYRELMVKSIDLQKTLCLPLDDAKISGSNIQQQILLRFEKELNSVLYGDLKKMRADILFLEQEVIRRHDLTHKIKTDSEKTQQQKIQLQNSSGEDDYSEEMRKLMHEATTFQLREAYSDLEDVSEQEEALLSLKNQDFEKIQNEIKKLAGALNEHFTDATEGQGPEASHAYFASGASRDPRVTSNLTSGAKKPPSEGD